MKNLTRSIPITLLGAAFAGFTATLALPAGAVDLLQRYPTTLTGGILAPGQARPWQFTPGDIYRVSRFRPDVGGRLKVETGPADLGIGHCADGAVCAILIPAEGGKLTRPGAGSEEVAHIWLRFHPKEINKLFPPATVSPAPENSVVSQMRTIIRGKFRASYHAGNNAMIPEPKDMTVDVDTKAGPRRFFVVDTEAGTAQYADAFEGQPVRIAAVALPSAAEGAGTTPRIITTTPADGAKDVDAGLTEITVTFDRDMGEGFSWTGGGPEFPRVPKGESPRWQDKRTCVLPVKLEPGHQYRVGINSPSHQNFCSAAGEPAEPSSISFTTK
jgi:RNA polymerase sigma-70 factor (ECF subfamily)